MSAVPDNGARRRRAARLHAALRDDDYGALLELAAQWENSPLDLANALLDLIVTDRLSLTVADKRHVRRYLSDREIESDRRSSTAPEIQWLAAA